jgi:hypothetical protein
MKNTFSTVHSKLDEFINRYYGIGTLRGLILFISTSTFLVLVAAMAVYFTDASVNSRTFLFLVLSAALVVQLFTWVLKPLLKRRKVLPRMSYMSAAQKIEAIDQAIGEKIINGLELESFQQDNDLIIASLDQLTEELKVFKGASFINYRRVKKVFWTIIPFALAAVLVFTSGNIDNLLNGTDRLVSFRSEFLPSDYVSFKILSDKEVAEGKDYRLVVELNTKELPSNVKVFVNGVEVSVVKEEGQVYSSLVRSVYESFSVSCQAGKYNSGEWNISVLKSAKVFNYFFEVIPPGYTNLEAFRQEGNNSIRVPENALVKWKGSIFNASNITVTLDSMSQLQLEGDEANFHSIERRVKENESWKVNNNNEELATYRLLVLKDNFPTIKIEQYRDSTTIDGFYFSGTINDDYGFRSLFLVQRDDETGEVKRERIDITSTKQQTFFIYKKVESNNKVYFEIRDNDSFNGYKKTTSSSFELNVVDEKKFKNEIGSSKAESKKQIEERIKEIKAASKAKDEKSIETQNKDQQKSFEDIQKLSEAFRKQMELEKSNNLYDEEILEKQEQLEERFDELDKDLQELLKEIERLEKELNKDQDLSESVDIKKEDVLDELDRMMEMLDRLQFEKDLDDAISELEKLEEEQKALSETGTDTEKEQEALKEKFEEVEKEIDELKEKSEELDMADLDEVKEEDGDEVKEDMEDAQEQQQKNSKKKANESQKKASEGIKKMKEKLKSVQMDMNASQQTENAEDLRMLLDNLLVLSTEEEALQDGLGSMNSNDPDYGEKMNSQGQFGKDYKIIEDSLTALMVRAPEIETQVLKEMNTIDRYFKKSSESLKDNKVKEGVSEIRYLLTSVNNLALMLDVSLENMQSQMSEPKSGDKSCDKPGSGKPGMSELKKRQQQLSKQAKQMQKEFGGSKPGKSKGEGEGKGKGEGGQSKGEQIGKMLGEQEMIRKGIKQKNGPGAGGNGELDELLRKNEEDIANRNFDSEFFERQKEIESKMLESEKAMLEREQDEKRESAANEDEYERRKRLAEEEYLEKKQSGFEQINWDKVLLSPFYEKKITNE